MTPAVRMAGQLPATPPSAAPTTLAGRWLAPFGFELQGHDLAELSDAGVAQLRRTLAAAGVVVARGQAMDDAGFAQLLSRLGPSMTTTGETPVPGRPTLNVVTNVGRTRRPRSVYHSDTSYAARPPAFTALRAVTVPKQGGETLFVCQYDALRHLPPPVRRAIEGVRVLHRASGIALGAELTKSWHPMVRLNPDSGRPALFLSTPARCVALPGVPAPRARRLLRLLYHHSTRRGPVYRHRWRAGDVVLWDNRCTLHRADHSAVDGDRTLHRGMVRGETPRPA
ncbi:MAG: TauD/TfdA family dioxygenase [Planctomycetota bacterium]